LNLMLDFRRSKLSKVNGALALSDAIPCLHQLFPGISVPETRRRRHGSDTFNAWARFLAQTRADVTAVEANKARLHREVARKHGSLQGPSRSAPGLVLDPEMLGGGEGFGSMRITLVVSQLGPGGAERVLSTMANHWSDTGVAVTVITIGSLETDFYALRPSISRRLLDLEGVSTTVVRTGCMTFRRLRALRRELIASKGNSIISFGDVTNVLTILATRGLGVPVLVSERIDPFHHDIGRLRNCFRRLVYRFADAVVVQTEQIAASMDSIVPRRLLRVIPNFARRLVSSSTAPRGATRSRNLLVSMGSLTPRKQFDKLLRVFAKVAERQPDWHLLILGEGPEREALGALAKQLGIVSKVSLPGLHGEPEQVLQQADLFALTSRYEGLPNVLLEAMACGLPVVSFDCPGGPRDIVRHEIDGLLVPDQDLEALAQAMDRLMSDPKERRAMGRRAREVTGRFSIGRVMAMWDGLIAECVERKRSAKSWNGRVPARG
jgi:glycosyltransferase involved in cell wall biosynthesis